MQEDKTKQTEVSLLSDGIFKSGATFDLAQTMAQVLAKSSLVPREYQGNVGNCMIAMELANRLSMSPIMVMQNLYIINSRPSWSSQFIIAMINSSNRYKTELRFEYLGEGENHGCYAYAIDKTGKKIEGPLITYKIAKEEGWVTKNGSKWKTMPKVMMRYRAASFFGRAHCPDLLMGIYAEEENEVIDVEPTEKTDELYTQNTDENSVLLETTQDIEQPPKQEAKPPKATPAPAPPKATPAPTPQPAPPPIATEEEIELDF